MCAVRDLLCAVCGCLLLFLICCSLPWLWLLCVVRGPFLCVAVRWSLSAVVRDGLFSVCSSLCVVGCALLAVVCSLIVVVRCIACWLFVVNCS